MKPAKSKAQERRELQQQMENFLKHGGKVNAIESGISGRDIGAYKLTPVNLNEPRESRTLLTDEVKAIEARKSKSHKSATATRPRRPKKVLITDDFGEPLRWSWTDDK
ncbi:MAG: hypothetical protein K6L75_14885 [Cellvibrionaceae bacterium]